MPEADVLLEQDAADLWADGHRYMRFDGKLITAAPHSGTVNGNRWFYNLEIGFTNVDEAAGTEESERCCQVSVTTEHPQSGEVTQTRSWSPAYGGDVNCLSAMGPLQ